MVKPLSIGAGAGFMEGIGDCILIVMEIVQFLKKFMESEARLCSINILFHLFNTHIKLVF